MDAAANVPGCRRDSALQTALYGTVEAPSDARTTSCTVLRPRTRSNFPFGSAASGGGSRWITAPGATKRHSPSRAGVRLVFRGSAPSRQQAARDWRGRRPRAHPRAGTGSGRCKDPLRFGRQVIETRSFERPLDRLDFPRFRRHLDASGLRPGKGWVWCRERGVRKAVARPAGAGTQMESSGQAAAAP